MVNTPPSSLPSYTPNYSPWGDHRIKRYVEAILDAGKHTNQEDFLRKINALLQKIYGENILLSVIKQGPNGRYFSPGSHKVIEFDADEIKTIERATKKAKQGKNGLYKVISSSDKNDEEDGGEYIVHISGNLDGQSGKHISKGMRELTEQFRKTTTSIKIQNEDPLTGLYNTHYRDRYAASCDHEEKKTPYAIIAIDLNKFKSINDTLGHYIGDIALQTVANAMKRIFPRSSDKIMRTGGDEFTLVIEFDNDTPPQRKQEIINTKMIQLEEILHPKKTHILGIDQDGTKIQVPLTFTWGSSLRNIDDTTETFEGIWMRADAEGLKKKPYYIRESDFGALQSNL